MMVPEAAGAKTIRGSGFWLSDVGFRVSIYEFGVSVFGFGASVSGFLFSGTSGRRGEEYPELFRQRLVPLQHLPPSETLRLRVRARDRARERETGREIVGEWKGEVGGEGGGGDGRKKERERERERRHKALSVVVANLPFCPLRLVLDTAGIQRPLVQIRGPGHKDLLRL